ncbi:uncharacterized protein LOC122049452 [Zingiber officinale]|uniref:uncharacterized protein LOC122049452 n=1 Tax=Zingiber officinale TaxID=94328 RepID=UPI001C4AC7EF|nr:uncharacterized protein LOC122049452 [Zingiber officinale]
MLRRLKERFQGKSHLKEICSEVFAQYASQDLLPLGNLQVAVLRVYNSLNKNMLGPHKEPPSNSDIEEKTKKLNDKGGIREDEFYNLMEEWTKKDLRIYMAHKLVLSLMAAPSLTLATKRVPKIGHVFEKTPTPILFSVYSIGLLLSQR